MQSVPSGYITFLFTDIEGSTKLSQEFPDTLQAALDKHHTILKKSIKDYNGFIFDITGDAFCCSFDNASDAVKAAVTVQLKLSGEKWEEAKIKVRIGIHSGEAVWDDKGYLGYITLARTARISSVAYGEQILISNEVYELFNETDTSKSNITFRDLGDRRLKDLIQPIRIYQVLSPGLRKDFPPLNTLDARANNLPVQITSFIGREKEIEEIKKLLSSSHLVTITGTGGAGKTRIALQVGADLIDDFSNGVWLAELASIGEETHLQEVLMKIFGLKEESDKSLNDTLYRYLKDKETLIILDNCEHIINACAMLAEKLLTHCPKLKIIATSRESLRCRGEQNYPLMSMELPGEHEEITLNNLTQYEAVRLFIERVLAVNPKFTVTNDNAPALAGICSRLDGIPLAIELAAARIKLLPVESIYERLDDRFNLLTGGKRTLPRQQTLRALIDWSHDFLSEHEKILWRRLSVFTGGWTLDGAESICSDETIDKEDLLELLNMLIEKSIVIFDDGKGRYMMLETLRQYGKDKFKDTGERNIIEKKYLRFYLKLAEESEPKLRSSEMETLMRRLDAENGNIKKSLLISVESGEYEYGIRLAVALGYFWMIQGLYSSGIHWLNFFLERGTEVSDSLRAKALYISGMLLMFNGEFEKSKKLTGESLEIYRNCGDKHGVTLCLNILASVASEQGRYDEATRLYEESLILRRETGDERGINITLANLGNVKFNQGEYIIAKKYIEESLDHYRKAGDRIGIANMLANLANVLFSLDEYDSAVKFLEDALCMQREMGDKKAAANSLLNLGDVSLESEDYLNAGKYLEESLNIFEEIEDRGGIANSLCELGFLAAANGEYEKALRYLEKSLSIRNDIADKQGIADCFQNLGLLYIAKKDFDEACKFFEINLKLRFEIGNKDLIAKALVYLGSAESKLQRYEEAKKHYRESLNINIETRKQGKIINGISEAAEFLLDIKNYKQAATLLGSIYKMTQTFKADKKQVLTKYDNINSALKEILGDEDYMIIFNKGKCMEVSDAVNYAF